MEHPGLIHLRFTNSTTTPIGISVEPLGSFFEIPVNHEYVFITSEENIHFEFSEHQLNLTQSEAIGFKLIHRKLGDKNWIVEEDNLDTGS